MKLLTRIVGLFFALTIVLTFFSVGVNALEPETDQQNIFLIDGAYKDTASPVVSQIFTPSFSGTLNTVAVMTYNHYVYATTKVCISVHEVTASGIPATESIAYSDCRDITMPWFSATFENPPLLSAGKLYAISVSGYYPPGIYFIGGNKYANGYLYRNNEISLDFDMGFQTIMTRSVYSVNFYDFDNLIFSSQQIPYGSSAIEPNAPKKVGYIFKGWDREYVSINSNQDIYPVYEIDQNKPIIDGVIDGKSYNVPKQIHFNEGTATLDGENFPNDGFVSLEGVHTLVVTDEAGNISEIVFEMDYTSPIITLAPYSSDPTNQDITVVASTNEGVLNSIFHTFTENGSFDFIATDAAGNTSTKIVTISHIDKTPPSIFGVENGGIYNSDRIITFSEGFVNLDGNSIISGFVVSEEGNYELVGVDYLGNTISLSFTIDKTAPEITFAEYLKTPTNKNIVVNAMTNEGSLNSTSHEFTENGSFTFYATDLAGNVRETMVTITNIDKTAPIITGIDAESYINITPTITFSEGTAVLDGKPFSGNTTIRTPGKHTLIVTDLAGNITTRTFTILVSLASPSNLKVSVSSYNTLNLSWMSVPFAEAYEVYRSTSSTGTYTFVGYTLSNTMTNTGLAFNTTYYYKVRAYTMVESGKVYGNYSSVVTAKTALTTPVTSVVSASYNSIRVSWAAIPGVSGYQVYRATSLAGTYTLLTSTSATSYTNSLLTTNTLYYYKVRGYRTVGTLKYYSAYSTVLSARPIPSQVIGNSVVSSGYNSLKASWAAVSGATGYEVYKSSAMDGTYTLVLTTGLTSYSFTSLPTNVPLFVKVRAYRLVGTLKIYGAFSTIQSSSPIPSNPLVTLTSLNYKSLKLSWAAVSGATGYEVYHREGENYVLVQESSDLSLTVDGLVSGVTHDYKVIAYRMEGETKVYSKETLISGKALPSVPTVSSLVNYNTIKLKWNAVEGAVGYEIHRSATATGTFALLSTVDVLEYNHLALAFNTSYFYKVRAYVVVNDVKVYGNFTGVLTVKTNVATPVVTVKSASYISTTVSWAAVSGASGYEISRATILAGPYTVIVPATSATSYVNSALTTNTLYYYRVRSYRLVGTVKYYSAYSTVVSVRPVPAVPTGASLTSVGYDSARLGWAAVTGASGYEVFTSDSLGGTYTLKTSTTGLSATISGLSTNVQVYAKVRAYRLVGTTKVVGDYSAIVNVAPIPATPVAVALSHSYKSIKVIWPAVAGADGYELYHIVNTESFLVQDSPALEYIADDLIMNEVHTYQVVAYRLVNAVKVYSNSIVVSGKAQVVAPTVKVTASYYDEMILSWNQIEGVEGYDIYRSTSATGTFTNVGWMSWTASWRDSGLAFNTTYYYKVRAYVVINNTKIDGPFSSVISGKTIMTPPGVKLESNSYTSVYVSWDFQYGAHGYELSRSTSATGTYTVLTTSGYTNYTNTGLAPDVVYYYRVRSYRTVGTVKYYSAYSPVVSIRPLPAIPGGVTMASVSHDSLKLNWTAVAGATGYEVYTSSSANGSYTLKSTVTSTTSTISGFNTNVPVFAKVRAYRVAGTVKTYSEYSYIVNAIPVLNKPVVTTKIVDVFTMKLTWPAVAGASGYEIYWFSAGIYLPLDDVTKPEYVDEYMFPGDSYTYKIVAYKVVSEERIYSEITTVTGVMLPPTPENFRFTLISQNKVYLDWEDTLIDGWEIYRATSSTGTYTKVADTYYDYVSITGLTFNTTYYFKARSYIIVDDTRIYSDYSPVLTAKTSVTTPEVFSTYATATTTYLSWTISENVAGYEVYKATSSTGTFTLAGTSYDPSYTFAATTGATYYYKVRAYAMIGGVKYYSAFTPVVSIKAAPFPSNTFYASGKPGSIELYWSTVSGASGYELSCSKSLTGTYTVLQANSMNTFNHVGLVTNDVYYYKLRSFVTINGVKTYGAYYANNVSETAGTPIPNVVLTQEYDQDLLFIDPQFSSTAHQVKIYQINDATGERTYIGTFSSYQGVQVSNFRGIVGQTLKFVAVSEMNFNGTILASRDSQIMTITLGQTRITGFDSLYANGVKVDLSWDAVPNEVEIWRAEYYGGTFTKIANGVYPTGKYTDTNVVANEDYYYQIRRISIDANTSQIVYSAFSDIAFNYTELEKPWNVVAVAKSPTDMKVTWNAIAGATGYEVYYVADNSTEVKSVLGVMTNSTYVSGLLPNTYYTFFVYAYQDLPGVNDPISEPSVQVRQRTPFTPVISVNATTTFEGTTAVTLDMMNNSTKNMEVWLHDIFAFDQNGVLISEYTAKDTLTQSPLNYATLNPAMTRSFDVTMVTPTPLTATDYLEIKVYFDGILFYAHYNPTQGVIITYKLN